MRGNAWTRGAEEFDALVSGATGDREANAELRELAELVSALRAVPEPVARPEFVSSLRTQLVAAAEREPARVDQDLAARLTPRQRRGSRERRLAAVVGGFAVVSATGSMAMAAQDALPGDVLYPVKRAIENAQTNLKSNGSSKAASLIAHAESRLDEVQELTARGADGDVVAETLQDFTVQATQASEFALEDYETTGKEGRIVELRAFARDSMDVIGALAQVIPADSRPALITAGQTIRQIDQAAWEACPTCAGGDVAELPDIATLPLSAVLNADLPDTASVTDPGKKPRKSDKPDAPAAPPSADPTGTPPDPVQPSDNASSGSGTDSVGGKVGKTVEEVTKGVTGGLGLGGDKPSQEPTTNSLTGTLIDGVAGVLGGLLGR